MKQNSTIEEMETLVREYSCCDSWRPCSWEVEEAMAKLESLCLATCKGSCLDYLDQAKNTMGILEKEAWLHHIEMMIKELSDKT